MTLASQIPSPASNPFATCWTRPGALAFTTTSDASVQACTAQLRNHSWRGQICGPHGAGKTTLLKAIHQAAEQEGLRCQFVRAGDFNLRAQRFDKQTVLLCDSFEQLPRWQRWRLRQRQFGLVVTTHRHAWLPTLADLRPSQAAAIELFQQLTRQKATPVGLADCQRCYRRRRGNLRELWFDLYDLHESRTRANGYAASA